MTRTTPTDSVTGVASGSLGTGTAVDDETTLLETPALPEPVRAPAPPPERMNAVEVAPTPEAETRDEAEPRPPSAPARATRSNGNRRDPYRPIGIALAAILVALAGLAVLSSKDTPAGAIVPPAATATPDGAPGQADGQLREERDGSDKNGHGNANGHGNGNGRGHGNGNGGQG